MAPPMWAGQQPGPGLGNHNMPCALCFAEQALFALIFNSSFSKFYLSYFSVLEIRATTTYGWLDCVRGLSQATLLLPTCNTVRSARTREQPVRSVVTDG